MKNKTLISLKKIINYALVAVVVASNLSFVPVAKAVGEPTVTIGSQSALNGATINVPVDASNFANAVAGMDFSVQYDSALLTYTGLTQNAISGHGTLLTNNNANPIPINWFDSVALNIDSGAILTLNFTVISAATTNVNLTFAGTKELSGVSDIINPTSFVPGVISLNPAPTLSSIAITTPATKLSYTVGDVLDLTGLVVTGTYSDASTQVETVTTSNVSGFDSSAPATGQVLTITVGGQIATYTVDIVTPVNSAKAITAFSFATPAATGVINEGTHTITVTVPFGTAVVALTPTIVITGTSISSLSGVAQDFTSPVVYTVTADDASTQNYTVTVIITAPSDLTALNAAIVSAQSLHDGANEGTTPGEYAVGSKAILQSAINTAALITSSEAQSVVDAAVVNLNAAITTFNAGLVALSDLSSLITAIASAQTLHDGATEGTSPGEYTVGSKAILQSAIDAASLITSSETQSVVNAAVITLNSAVATFQASVVGDSDVTALNAAIASAQAIDLAAVAGTAPGQYPASAKTTLEAAIATAQTVNASDDQSIVDAAVVTLNVAVTTFQSTVIGTSDLSALSAAIASAQTLHDGAIEGIVPGNHTIGSKAIYQTAINNASLLTASDDQADIDTTVVTLASATNTFNASLVGASDLTVLSAAITSAQSLHDGATEGTAVGEYAVGSKAILQSAIDAASLVTSAEAQSVVNTAVTTLNSAVAVFSTQIIVGISSESNETPSSNSVTITWTTTHPATSRVVYDTVSHNPVTDQAPNYGYSNSTAEDTTLVTNHSITVTSLLPSTTYFFRSVSHGSPETYGNEVSVATTATPPSGGGGGSSFVVLSQPGFSGSTAFQTFPATAIIPTVSETTVRTVTPQVLGVRVFAEGALLRVDGQSIYIAQGNILHKIPNSDVLRRFASRTRIDITVEDIVGYTIGSSIPNAMPTYIARTLLRVNERDIYVVNGRMLNRVPNPRTLWPYRDYARIEVAGDALIEFTIGDSVPVL